MSTIKVRLKDVGGNVIHPETDWSIVQNKPSSYPTTWSEVNGRPSSYPTTWSEVNGRPSIAFKTHTGDTSNPVSEIWERSSPSAESDTKSFTSTISMTTSRIVSAATMGAAYGGSKNRCYLQAEASKNEQVIRLRGQKILMDAGQKILMNADEITVCDEYTGNSYVPLNQYPIEWTSIANKPSNGDESGVYLFQFTMGLTNFTTVLICTHQVDAASGETYTTRYLDDAGDWVLAPSGWQYSATKLF